MKNLAGDKECDDVILEELYLANIPAVKIEKENSEVPYTYIGRIGNWTFKRQWYYWSVSTEKLENGLPLKQALELHNKVNPVHLNEILGMSIRSGGHAGSPSPDEYGARTSREEDKIGERFVDSYHIDDQIGLNEFVKKIISTKVTI